eukprot:TRINITY_DN3449_c0_g1_i1.p1 TRINITY_DN3449_c0_g1~~TRINITY_DN3449_c0_g1_i1.p1  ORF type:complete len:150 (+),score=25.22 TRINITY_DN3449_c0_g1_i1:125-574(+)
MTTQQRSSKLHFLKHQPHDRVQKQQQMPSPKMPKKNKMMHTINSHGKMQMLQKRARKMTMSTLRSWPVHLTQNLRHKKAGPLPDIHTPQKQEQQEASSSNTPRCRKPQQHILFLLRREKGRYSTLKELASINTLATVYLALALPLLCLV